MGRWLTEGPLRNCCKLTCCLIPIGGEIGLHYGAGLWKDENKTCACVVLCHIFPVQEGGQHHQAVTIFSRKNVLRLRFWSTEKKQIHPVSGMVTSDYALGVKRICLFLLKKIWCISAIHFNKSEQCMMLLFQQTFCHSGDPQGFVNLLGQDILFHNLPVYWPGSLRNLELCCILMG